MRAFLELVCILSLSVSLSNCILRKPKWNDNLKIYTTKNLEDYQLVRYFNGTSDYSHIYNLTRMTIIKDMMVASKDHLVIAGQETLFFFLKDNMKVESWYDDEDKIGTDIKPDEFYTLELRKKDVLNKANSLYCQRKKDLHETYEYESICKNHAKIFTKLDNSGKKLLLCTSQVGDPKCTIFLDAKMEYNKVRLTDPKVELDEKISSIISPSYEDNRVVNSVDGDFFWSTSFTLNQRSPKLIKWNITEMLSGDIKQMSKITPPVRGFFSSERGTEFIAIKHLSDRTWVFYNDFEVFHGNSVSEKIEWNGFVAQICSNASEVEPFEKGSQVAVLKARIVCKIDSSISLNAMRQVFFLPNWSENSDEFDRNFFILYTNQKSQTPNSGICVFNTGRIRDAFEGNFADPEVQGHFELRTDMWKNLKERGVHPGFCPQPSFDNVTYETEKTTKNPEGLIGLKSYFYNNNKMAVEVNSIASLAWNPVRFTIMDVRLATGPYQNYTMFYIGSEDGHVYKALSNITLGKIKIIEKINVFDVKRCGSVNKEELKHDKKIRSISIDEANNLLRIGFSRCVLWKKLDDCSVHKCQEECFRSSDPNCGWSFFNHRCEPFKHPGQRLHQLLYHVFWKPEDFLDCAVKIPTILDSIKTNSVTTTTEKRKISTFYEKTTQIINVAGNKLTTDDNTMVLILVVILTVFGTLSLVLLGWCCSKKIKNSKKTNFQQKQLNMQRQELKSPLTFKQRLLCKCNWFNIGISKRNSPVGSSPTLRFRNCSSIYSESSTAPLIKQVSIRAKKDGASRPLHILSRHDSTISRNFVERNNSEIENFELQPISKRVSDDPTYTTLTRNDPINISFSQRQILDNHQQHGNKSLYENVSHFHHAPTESAKIRRKNASLKANEIMRDSSGAVERFENVFNGIMNGGVNETLHTRCRIDSEDSGKGKSVRNSYENEDVKSGRPYSFQPEKLDSIYKRRRVRLVSEPAYEHLYSQYVSPKPLKILAPSSFAQGTLLADRHSSPRHKLISSQPTTPNNRFEKVFFNFPDPNMTAPQISSYISVPSYATLPKQHNVSVQRKNQIPIKGNYPLPSKNMIVPTNVIKSHIPVFTGPRNTSSSLPNRYPSMQVRGCQANMTYKDRRRHLSCGPPSYQELKMGERSVTKTNVKRSSSTASSYSAKKSTPPPAYDEKLV